MKTLLLSVRSLMHFRLYAFINIMGLALSLACTISIGRYLYSEWMTDRFNSQHQRICLSARIIPNNEQPPILCTTENVLLKKNFHNPLDLPEVERMTSFVSLSDVSISIDNQIFGVHALATDSVFLQVFDFPLLAGSTEKVLAKPENAVISKAFAQKVFGNGNPIGKNIQYNEHLLTIQGITGETSTASSLSFDLLISKQLQWRWPPVNHHTAVVLSPGTDIEALNRKLIDNNNKAAEKYFEFQLIPLDKLYLDTTIRKGENTFRQGNAGNLGILSLVALLILLTGLFNFIQVSSAITLKRGRELGLKKVFGARLKDLFLQLYTESLVLTAFALLLAWVFIEITRGFQTELFQMEIIPAPAFNCWLSVGLLFGLPLCATLFPIGYHRRKSAAVSLQNILPKKNKMGVRSLFLVMQYCIACGLIITSLLFMKQLNFMLDKDPGYRTKDIIKAWFQRPSSAMVYSNEELEQNEALSTQIINTVEGSPLFSHCCYGSSPYEFSSDWVNQIEIRQPGQEWQKMLKATIQADYFSLYAIPVPAQSRPVTENEVLINETARKLLSGATGIPSVIEYEQNNRASTYLVKGVIPDFQTTHLSLPNKPLILLVRSNSAFSPDKLMAAITPGKKQEAISFLKELHGKTVGGEFEYSFVEDEYKAIYDKDKQITLIYGTFAFIAILIASLGLFSLSLFDVQQRFREIAIRKISGATTSIIMQMLLGNYYKLLITAFILSAPVAWLASHKYLEGFAYKTSISWWIFAIALLITGSISILTLTWQIQRAARMNPVDAIKND